MPNTTITLNSITLAPTSIEVTITKIGESTRMGDGTLRFFYRGTKRSWSLSWEGLPHTSLSAIFTAFNVNTAVTFVDEFGSSYTVLSAGEFSQELSAEDIGSNGVFYYNVSFTIDQV